MSNRIKQFIENNREAFDDDTPPPRVWANIESRMMLERKTRSAIKKMNFWKWTAAAALVGLIALGIGTRMNTTHHEIAQNITKKIVNTPVAETLDSTPSPTIVSKTGGTKKPQLQKQESTKKTKRKKEEPENFEAGLKAEITHYANLVEAKQNELKMLTAENPEYSRQFANDLAALDSSYHALQSQTNSPPNQEVIIEAMIRNLQLQVRLLSRQLYIIHQIKNSKNESYEKNNMRSI
jgi:hypothetical protein